MRRYLLVLPLLLVSVLSSAANRQRVRDLDIHVTLMPLGGAVFHETWDLNTGDDITEWYLVRENLGDMEIGRFQVLDENGTELADDGEWDVHRTLEQKAGKSGIVHKANGLELCWGVGSHGDHVFHAFYSFVNAVKSLNDYDMFHMQLVSPGLSSPPEHVRVTIEAKDRQLDTLNTRAWAFGYVGSSAFQEDGTVVFESSSPFMEDDYVVVLLRLEKGLFTCTSVQERDFQEVLDEAFIGSDYGYDSTDDDDGGASGIASFFGLLFIYFVFIRPFFKGFASSKSKRDIAKVLGERNPRKVSWSRSIPMNGNLGEADCVLSDIGESSGNNLALALILRFVHTGYLRPTREINGPLQLAFTGKQPDGLDSITLPFYHFLKQAAGEDKVLQDKEFSTWAKSHSKEIYDWTSKVSSESRTRLWVDGWYNNGKYTSEGKEQARNVVGFKNFLSDFTLVDKREAFEANLWKEYLVYAALFGIADRVADQLKDIDPSFFKETFAYDANMLPQLLTTSRAFASAVRDAAWRGRPVSYSSGSSGSSSSSYHRSSGYGGSSSHRGGGGYSGGGRGGGGR